jgi:hypothetical protein
VPPKFSWGAEMIEWILLILVILVIILLGRAHKADDEE